MLWSSAQNSVFYGPRLKKVWEQLVHSNPGLYTLPAHNRYKNKPVWRSKIKKYFFLNFPPKVGGDDSDAGQPPEENIKANIPQDKDNKGTQALEEALSGLPPRYKMSLNI